MEPIPGTCVRTVSGEIDRVFVIDFNATLDLLLELAESAHQRISFVSIGSSRASFVSMFFLRAANFTGPSEY
jgi:hypothetical protein